MVSRLLDRIFVSNGFATQNREAIETTVALVIMVAMLCWFPPDLLPPHVIHRHFAPTEMATLNGLQRGAREVEEDCVQWSRSTPLADWQPMGKLSKDMGVFVWKTDSYLDRLFRPAKGLAMPSFANNTSTARL